LNQELERVGWVAGGEDVIQSAPRVIDHDR
jgi:hypothetical protein